MATPPPTTVNSEKNTAKNTAVSIELEIIGMLSNVQRNLYINCL